ncbi:hypothetical protein D6D10_07627 [Aureobasidium pullulans]|uniref:Uncharacterized protein n=1 Tax=Aureobasidium pullulans TaxID=5580 RepID=A0A4S9EIK8_AURPU|nr:hypothetical protein D6D10_07627 [Aureobasidium pullulans]
MEPDKTLDAFLGLLDGEIVPSSSCTPNSSDCTHYCPHSTTRFRPFNVRLSNPKDDYEPFELLDVLNKSYGRLDEFSTLVINNLLDQKFPFTIYTFVSNKVSSPALMVRMTIWTRAEIVTELLNRRVKSHVASTSPTRPETSLEEIASPSFGWLRIAHHSDGFKHWSTRRMGQRPWFDMVQQANVRPTSGHEKLLYKSEKQKLESLGLTETARLPYASPLPRTQSESTQVDTQDDQTQDDQTQDDQTQDDQIPDDQTQDDPAEDDQAQDDQAQDDQTRDDQMQDNQAEATSRRTTRRRTARRRTTKRRTTRRRPEDTPSNDVQTAATQQENVQVGQTRPESRQPESTQQESTHTKNPQTNTKMAGAPPQDAWSVASRIPSFTMQLLVVLLITRIVVSWLFGALFDIFNNNKGAVAGLTTPNFEILGPVSTKSESSSKSGSVQPGTLDDVSPANALEALMQDEADCAADRFGEVIEGLNAGLKTKTLSELKAYYDKIDPSLEFLRFLFNIAVLEKLTEEAERGLELL